jgi:hypothetical protein
VFFFHFAAPRRVARMRSGTGCLYCTTYRAWKLSAERRVTKWKQNGLPEFHQLLRHTVSYSAVVQV